MHGMTTRAHARKLAIRSMLTVAAAAAMIASGATAGEAKSRKQWRNANAAVTTSGSFSGKASYYGSESGARTASGARYNPMGMTAAHRSLPFGTRLKVTHGSRSVLVTVNDRGPFIRGRVLDLSKGAAQAIGLTGRGIGHVVAEVQ
jgi:rare lipoprotein A